MLPTSIIEDAKNGRWVSYTFLQKPSSFKFLSILEENCVANINNGAFKCKFLLTNVSKNGRWVSYTFLQKLNSFNFYSILEENCVANINNEAFECNIFVDNCCKNSFWVSYTFLQKPSLFKDYWIWPSFSRNFFLFENQRFWRNQYLKVLMASKCDENKNWLSKTQKKSNVSLENDFNKMLVKKS